MNKVKQSFHDTGVSKFVDIFVGVLRKQYSIFVKTSLTKKIEQ